MIARGSMVALKGHHLWPMVVVYTFGADRGLPPPGSPQPVHDTVRVTWIDAHGVPRTETYPLEILEELDG